MLGGPGLGFFRFLLAFLLFPRGRLVPGGFVVERVGRGEVGGGGEEGQSGCTARFVGAAVGGKGVACDGAWDSCSDGRENVG